VLDKFPSSWRRFPYPYLQATVRRYVAHERGPLEGLVVTQYPI
jgi:hypothetical protein